MLIRKPHVAGTFYPADPPDLKAYCQNRLTPEKTLCNAKAVILPHAGYIYSGDTACSVLTKVRIPHKIFLMGPNHWGVGAPFSIYPDGLWETPLGKVSIDHELCRKILESSPLIQPDADAHRGEHSLEVLVPLLQSRVSHLTLAPMIVGTLDRVQAREAALAIGKCLAGLPDTPLVVISNDMSHYESDEATRKKDRYAIDAILNLDAEALDRAAHDYRITMCGIIPVYMLLIMKEALKISKATLVDYRTSADASGDRQRVVGYAGFIFE